MAKREQQGGALGVSVGSRCYIPDKQRMWIPVVVEDVDEQKRKVTVRLEKVRDSADDADDDDKCDYSDASAPRRVIDVDDKTVLPLQNTEAAADSAAHLGCDDMIELNHLHEAAILYNLKTRFHARLPYTYTGDICLALNPYQWLDELYSAELHTQYLRAPSRKHLPPHVYAVAVSAYQHMAQHATNQSILVSGESGAGKTETTKIVMDNLASIARAGSRQETIRKILDVNPLLESFGNAKTKRNDNSSRFGKFTQLQFDHARVLCGAKCETYLLEKTRVVTQEPGERNYHIFYQLLHGTTSQERDELALDASSAPAKFAYVQEDASLMAKDVKNLAKTKHALALLGLGADEQRALFQALSGILHLGEAAFERQPDNEDASQLALDSVAFSSTLLGLDAAAMNRALCSRTMRAGGEVYAVPLSVAHASAGRDALAKAIYAKVFDWMVARINASLSADGTAVSSIGVLDIFGFESFVHNSYEQLCINYANEKLQQKFTQDVFTAVEDEYAREQISYAHIAYADNAQVLSLLESKLGVLALLNEELVRPKGSDEGFVAKLATQYRTAKSVVEFARISRTQFTIHHYADSVQYDATGFLDKHKDALLPDLSELMRASAEPFVLELFAKSELELAAEAAVAASGGGLRRRGGAGGGDSAASATVGTQFKQSLNKLMDSIGLTNVHYIRCIKPNSVKSAHVLDERMVVNQLRCAGVIEAISIARAGYPNRLLHAAFASAFDIFLSDAERTRCDATHQCALLIKHFALVTPLEFQMGTTKIYLQKGVLERLEHARAAKLFAFAAVIQSRWRGVCARERVAVMRRALALLQRRIRGFAAVVVYQRQRRTAGTLQRVWRGHVGRKIFFAALCEHRATQIQRVWRGHAGRKIFFAALCTRCAVCIQCAVRQWRARRELMQRRDAHAREQARLRELKRLRQLEQARLHRLLCERSAVVIQSRVRGVQARRAFVTLVQYVVEQRQRDAAEQQRLRAIAEREERERQLALQREQQQREECELEAKQLQAAITVQKVTRGRLARQQFAVLRVEAMHAEEEAEAVEAVESPEMVTACAENERLRQQLAEMLEANLELESLVSEWQCERDVLNASNHVKELDLRQRISNKQQQLETARAEHSSLSDLLDKSSTRSTTETIDSNGSTETETLSSASEPEDDDDDGDNDDRAARWPPAHKHEHALDRDSDFAGDRPSVDVAHLLAQRASKPRFSNVMAQRTQKPAQLFRAGAKQLGMAKKWVNTTRRTGKAAKVHGELDVESPVPARGVAL